MKQTATLRTVQGEHGPLSYTLERKQVKRINLRVRPDWSVRVSAPPGYPTERIDAFVVSLSGRIHAAQERMRRRQEALPPPRTYRDGERFFLLGEPVRLAVRSGPADIRQEGDTLLLTLPRPEDDAARERLVQGYLRERCQAVFSEIAGELLPRLAPWGVSMPKIRVRTMRSRWGSCSPGKGAVTLNTELLPMPRGCVAYVVLHELCHFVHPNHSGDFYTLLSRLMPDRRERKELLEALARQGLRNR